ncbi:endonuclease domain-containing 1 protein-like isoform X1 [Salvelinus sp. IW2-2015]|uniref:endonuclease domain-containing 1 protein-like isoform X1 n=1 Tax=Salvelinus sp. IW2-2015 TaxID=2691554 RepID=UPI000CEAB49D|nr:endonuclease domain-containing 1 protein-like isoform X1 [Salvelinus alpinus]
MMGILNHLSTLLLLSLLPPALSHVVKKFSDVTDCEKFFLNGSTPNLPGILVDGIVQNQGQNEGRYKPICQKYKKIYRFATLYDTFNRIPVFSAYTFTGNSTEGRPNQPWMIEPELNMENNNHEMQVDHPYQAVNYDYSNSIKEKDVNRGHLFPNSHAHYLDTQKSTFTLTNIVPQVVSFNNGSWSKMEDYVRTKFKTDCNSTNGNIEAYLVTGAVPSKRNTLKYEVNIPDLMWTAYCCYSREKKEWMAEAHWGSNKKVKGKTLKPETLGALEKMLNNKLKQHYPGGGVQVFPKQCPRGSSQKEREREVGSGYVCRKR